MQTSGPRTPEEGRGRKAGLSRGNLITSGKQMPHCFPSTQTDLDLGTQSNFLRWLLGQSPSLIERLGGLGVGVGLGEVCPSLLNPSAS